MIYENLRNPISRSINKVLLEHSCPHLCIVYCYFCNKVAELRSCDRDQKVPQNLKYLLFGPL